MTGRHHSAEIKKKWSNDRSGEKNIMFGKKHTSTTIKKIADKLRIQCIGMNNPRARKLYQYDKEKKLIKIWDYCKDCYNFYGVSASWMSVCAKNNSSSTNYKKIQGFIFSFNPL